MTLSELKPGRMPPVRPARPAPLLPVALGLIAGIIVDNALAQPVSLSIGLLSAALVAGAVRAARKRAGWILVCAAAAGLGSLRHALADRWLPSDHVARYAQGDPSLARIRGEVVSKPLILEPDEDVPRAFSRGPKTVFVLETSAIAGRDGWIETQGLVQVSVKEPMLLLTRGQFVEMTGWLYQPRPPQNPGDYDWALQKKRDGLRAGLACDHAESVVVLRQAGGPGFQGILDSARQRLRGYLLDDAFEEDEPGAGVMAAMVLGERSAVSREMNEAFIRTGNAHLLAASGMNVAWLALVGWTICRVVGTYYRTTAVIVALLIVSYVLIAEPRPSILRAGITGVLLCGSAFFRGRYNSVNALACAAVAILMIRPTDCFSPAFQFSFMATLGLLHFCPLVSGELARWFLGRRMHRTARAFGNIGYPLSLIDETAGGRPARPTIADWIVGLAAQLFALAISEWLLTAPLACYHFNQFAPWGWFGTFIAGFFAMPATCLGYATTLCGLVLPSSGAVLGPIFGATSRAMLSVLELMAKLPAALIDGRSPSLAWVLAVYAVIWLWGYRRGWLPWRRAYAVAALVLIAWWLIPPRWLKADRSALVVWMLAVGDGTGTVIELPDGKVLIYDFGTRSAFDAGPLAERFLRHRGIRRIDRVFVSHADFDHLSAVEHIVTRFNVGRVIINDQFERFAPDKSSGRRFLQAMSEHTTPVEVVSGPCVFDDTGGAEVEAIWPPAENERRMLEANDSSTVLRLSYQGRSVLLTGDVSEAGLAAMLSTGDLKSDVLALPHHGSVVHDTGRFIEAVDPRVAVRSTGQHRAMTTNGIERLVGRRTYYSTADDGCIKVRIDKGGVCAAPAMRDSED